MSQVSAPAAVWNSEARLPLRRTIPLLFRSFFLQASWSFERMQSVGWTAALAGEGRRLAPGEKAVPFLRRHLGYFNTNPVLASYLLGGVVRLEEEVAAGRATVEEVARFKRGLTSPLASWGDAFFWATLRPAATAIGVVVALLFGGWGAVVYLLTYNAFHLYYRVRGLREGYRWGPTLSGRLSGLGLRSGVDWARAAGLAAAGALTTLSFDRIGRSEPPVWPTAFPLLLVGSGFLAFLVLRRRAGLGVWLGMVAVAAGLLYAWVASGR